MLLYLPIRANASLAMVVSEKLCWWERVVGGGGGRGKRVGRHAKLKPWEYFGSQ
jgi:hypothetical protein